MKKILLLGRNGQVGWELQRALQPLGVVVAPDRGALDIADPDAIRRAIRELAPQAIVNAAAYSAVDKAESEPELAMAINAVAPGVMAEEARRSGATMIHYSTDYVFDGTKQTAYTEDDSPNPLNVYGRSKQEGERAVAAAGGAHLIFRTSWIYSLRGGNFLLTMLRLARERSELRVVADQFGTPTWARLIAEVTAQVLAQDGDTEAASGIYHLSAGGQTSWYGFAQAIFAERAALNGESAPRLLPISTAEYPLPAQRPANSVLSNAKLQSRFGLALPDWREGLRLCLQPLAT